MKKQQILQETSIKLEKRVKQCCQLYLQDAKPCGYEGQILAFLQPQLHTKVGISMEPFTFQNFKLKLATLN